MYVLGIDLGTGGCKALLMDAKGKVIAKGFRSYACYEPFPAWSEQEPEEWMTGVFGSIVEAIAKSGVAASEIRALAISGQMVGLVALDEADQPVRPCILWNDQRSVEQAREVTEALGLQTVLEETGNVVFPSFFAPKALWMREHEPELYGRVRRLLFPKDYVLMRLSGQWVSDVSDMSGSCVWNPGTRTYSAAMLNAFGIAREMMPDRVLQSQDIVGQLTPQAALATGLSAETIVVAGGGDQSCQAIGSGIAEPGRCGVTIGTSGVVFMQTTSYTPHSEGLLHAFCHSVPDSYYLMGVMLSAGGSYKWLRARLAQINPGIEYEDMNRLAQNAPEGSGGLLFLPYLSGERCPHNDPNASGSFVGLKAWHGMEHIVRSVMEGVTFGLKECLEMIAAQGHEIQTVYASGGAAASDLWLQMLADVFEVPVCTTNATEGGAFGAGMLALAAVEKKPVAELVNRVIEVQKRFEPRQDVAPPYRAAYERFTQLYSRVCAGEA